MNPYVTLGVQEDANTTMIRKAYLSLIKMYTPEHAPKRFQLITNAYNTIDTETKRINNRFLNESARNEYTSPFEVLELSTKMPHSRKPLSKNKFKEFLIKCATT